MEAVIEPLVGLATALHDACLLVAGYHRDNSNTWRRVRRTTRGMQGRVDMARKQRTNRDARTAGEVQVAHAAMAAEQEGVDRKDVTAFLDLAARVDRRRPKPEELAALERMMAANPGLWRTVGDLGREATNRMLDQLNASPATRLAFLHGAETMRRSVAGENAPALEVAMAEQIMVCWVRLRMYGMWLTQSLDSDDRTLIDFWEHLVSRAQKRFVDACEALARIRRLAALTPQLVQINVEERKLSADDFAVDELIQEARRRLSEWREGMEKPPKGLLLPGRAGGEGGGEGDDE